jgi:aspartokinase
MSGPESDIVVMKFGGTSVAGAEEIKSGSGRWRRDMCDLSHVAGSARMS